MSDNEKELPVIEDPDRDDVIERVRAAAWDEGRECEHCRGSGRVRDGSNRRVHSRGSFIGADWDLEDVESAVIAADKVAWGPGFLGHDLAVRVDGKWMKFDVPHPGREAEVTS